jgi:predicted amidophosphoribosyltransferase
MKTIGIGYCGSEYPGDCADCGEPIMNDEYWGPICPGCSAPPELRAELPARCAGCGVSGDYSANEHGECHRCAALAPTDNDFYLLRDKII